MNRELQNLFMIFIIDEYSTLVSDKILHYMFQ